LSVGEVGRLRVEIVLDGCLAGTVEQWPRRLTDNFDRFASARGENAPFSASRGRRLAKFVINRALSATRMGDGMKV